MMRKSRKNPVFKQIRGKYTDALVLENPNLREMLTLMKAFPDKTIEDVYPIGAIVTKDNVYVWAGLTLLPGEVATHLNEKIEYTVEIFYLIKKNIWGINNLNLLPLFRFLKNEKVIAV